MFCQDKKIHFLKVDKSYESDKIKHRCKKSRLSMKFEGIVVTDWKPQYGIAIEVHLTKESYF